MIKTIPLLKEIRKFKLQNLGPGFHVTVSLTKMEASVGTRPQTLSLKFVRRFIPITVHCGASKLCLLAEKHPINYGYIMIPPQTQVIVAYKPKLAIRNSNIFQYF